MISLKTDRLILRQWQKSDVDDFVAMNQDELVMKHFPNLLTKEQSLVLIERIKTHFEKYGYGLFALELKETKKFIGFCGLANVPFESHFTPAVEIGWRLASQFHGKGYATEAAKEVLRFAFENLKLSEIVSFTVPKNKASIRVMEKIGMKRDEEGNFKHPKLAKDHPLSWHVLYRVKNPLKPLPSK